jgi:hypothetical protein
MVDMKYVVYAKYNKKWVKVKEFTSLQEANHEMRKQVWLLKAEAASVEKED